MPDDDGYKYALTVIDANSRACDAEPLKTKTADEVLKAFKKIYNRNYLKLPKYQLQVDAGNEFKGVVAKYFKDKHVSIRVGKPGRSRMQAMVERLNQTIGSALHKRMVAQELFLEQTSKQWVSDLPKLIGLLNKRAKKAKRKPPPNIPVCEGDSCNTLNRGDKVRVQLDHPIDYVTHERLHGKFRSGDIRWHPTERIIREVLIKPNSPPLYLLNGVIGSRKVEPVAYTKNQLQVIPKNEQLPKPNVIRGQPTQYVVEKILGKKKIQNKIYYNIKWKGYKDAKDQTWEPKSTLIKQVPELIKAFESNN